MRTDLLEENKNSDVNLGFSAHRNISILGFIMMLLPIVYGILISCIEAVCKWNLGFFDVRGLKTALTEMVLLAGISFIGLIMFIHFIFIKTK